MYSLIRHSFKGWSHPIGDMVWFFVHTKFPFCVRNRSCDARVWELIRSFEKETVQIWKMPLSLLYWQSVSRDLDDESRVFWVSMTAKYLSRTMSSRIGGSVLGQCAWSEVLAIKILSMNLRYNFFFQLKRRVKSYLENCLQYYIQHI